jgi:preprotein translocase subunit SecB
MFTGENIRARMVFGILVECEGVFSIAKLLAEILDALLATIVVLVLFAFKND